jgi:hypothetical protein
VTQPDGASRAWRVAAGITALATIALVPPWRAAAIPWWSVADTSWMLGLHVAFAAGWRWGHDVVFSYGPLGFLATRLYDSRTRLVMLARWVALAVLLWAAVWTLVRRRAGRPWSAIVWVPAWSTRRRTLTSQPSPRLSSVGASPPRFICKRVGLNGKKS